MHTLIIGTGNLSKALYTNLGNQKSTVLSSRAIIENPRLLTDFLEKESAFNLVLNCFQRSTDLYQVSATTLIKNSLENLAIILDRLTPFAARITKIIYTSSSAVYGAHSSENCLETTPVSPMSLHGSLKLSCENLVSLFGKKHGIDYTHARIFNLFGGDDNFSLIYRLIQSIHSDRKFTLVNEGRSLRDYIHIDDAVFLYERLLQIQQVPVLNIGSGTGISARTIIDRLNEQGIFLTLQSTENPAEIPLSVASRTLTEKYIGSHAYRDVFSWIKQRI